MAKTKISWATHTLNFYGWHCTKISPGCKNCYLFRLAKQFGKPDPSEGFSERFDAALKELRRFPDGSVIFVNSMSDTYHDRATLEDVQLVHDIIADYPQHKFIVATKRPTRAKDIGHLLEWPDNLWLMVSVENEDYLWRIDEAMLTPAKHVAVSAEPLLGRLAGISDYLDPVRAQAQWARDFGVEWLIAGGESGPDFREVDQLNFTHLYVQCGYYHVPFFFKQHPALESETIYLDRWHEAYQESLRETPWPELSYVGNEGIEHEQDS